VSAGRLGLEVSSDRLAVVRLDPDAEVPAWATRSSFHSLTRTEDELSVVCAEADVPAEVTAERGFRRLTVCGPLEFSLVGVLASLTAPLARAGVSLFSISTFDTDHLLVREADLDRACRALESAGHCFTPRTS
jgi:hypothetical protein